MSRTLSLGLAIVLAVSTWLCAGATSGSAADETVRDPVVKAFVEYGDPPVTVPPGSRLRLSFAGERGDIVRVTGALPAFTTLRSSGRRLRETWSGWSTTAPRFYRLGADHRYTFTFRDSTDPYPDSVQLEKLVVRRLVRDGESRRFGSKRRGFVPAVSFDLDPGERTLITTPAYHSTVLTGHHARQVWGDPILEVGQRLTSARGDWDTSWPAGRFASPSGSPLRGGNVIVLTGYRGKVRAIGSKIVSVALDGDLGAVPARRAPREVALRFSATSGQLVHLAGLPAGTQVSPAMHGTTQSTMHAPGGPVWRVLEAGAQTISLFPGPGTRFHVGAAVVSRIGSMTAGGPALTFSAPEPGRWVYADVDGGYAPALTATAWTFATGVPWSASITNDRQPNCVAFQGPLGCGDFSVWATVTESTPHASAPHFPLSTAGAFVFLQVPPGTTGSVDLQVTKSVPPAG